MHGLKTGCVRKPRRLVRFVETQFDQERTTSDIRRLFGKVMQISLNPMPLRDIFVTLARNASKPA